jgi:hypothetical protein
MMNILPEWKITNETEHSFTIDWEKVSKEEKYHSDVFVMGSDETATSWFAFVDVGTRC